MAVPAPWSNPASVIETRLPVLFRAVPVPRRVTAPLPLLMSSAPAAVMVAAPPSSPMVAPPLSASPTPWTDEMRLPPAMDRLPALMVSGCTVLVMEAPDSRVRARPTSRATFGAVTVPVKAMSFAAPSTSVMSVEALPTRSVSAKDWMKTSPVARAFRTPLPSPTDRRQVQLPMA